MCWRNIALGFAWFAVISHYDSAQAQAPSPCAYDPPARTTDYVYGSDTDYTGTYVQFDLNNYLGAVGTWTLAGKYAPSRGHPTFSYNEPFSIGAGDDYAIYGTNAGGAYTWSVNQPSSNTNSPNDCSESGKFFITGANPPVSEFYTQMNIQYAAYSMNTFGVSPPTPNLITGISYVESNSNQFVTRTLFGQAALWPTESYDGGSHIGLLQLQWTNATVKGDAEAWNWYQNVSDGVNVFFGYASNAARRLAGKIVAAHTNLSQPTALMLEQMSVAIYHGHAIGPTGQYYTAQCQSGTVKGTTCVKGTWTWVVNAATANEQESQSYVTNVYANLAP